MAGKRELVLDAAIELLGTRGSRGLTHRGVDEMAGVPVGSTSNYFRTRDALIEGVVARLVECDQADWEQLASAPRPTTVSEFVQGLTAYVQHSAHAHRTRTAARYALALEALSSPPVENALRRGRADLIAWAMHLLENLPGADDEMCAILLDYADGVLLHQVTMPSGSFDPGPRLTVLAHALLGADR